jgi:hypothetical protein
MDLVVDKCHTGSTYFYTFKKISTGSSRKAGEKKLQKEDKHKNV